MTDFDRGQLGAQDEDRLPWLEAVDDEDASDGPGFAKLAAAVVVALVAIGLVIGGVFWMKQRGASDGDGSLIAAPEGDYKIPAEGAEANGMTVAGEGDATYAASQGDEINSAIDLSRQPEAPITGTPLADSSAVRTKALPPSTAAPAPASVAAPPAALKPVAAAPKPAAPKPVVTAAPKPAAPAASGPGGTIQLGAFNSEAIAKAEWSLLARKFPSLGALGYAVTTVQSGGKTLYRLRASGAGAAKVCATVKAGGKPCNVVS